jgi:hypothetical protein
MYVYNLGEEILIQWPRYRSPLGPSLLVGLAYETHLSRRLGGPALDLVCVWQNSLHPFKVAVWYSGGISRPEIKQAQIQIFVSVLIV